VLDWAAKRCVSMVVLDELELPHDRPELEPRFLLHVMDEPRVDGNTIVARHGGGRLTATVLLPRSPRIELIGSPGREFEVDGKNYPLKRPLGSAYTAGAWRAEVTAAPGSHVAQPPSAASSPVTQPLSTVSSHVTQPLSTASAHVAQPPSAVSSQPESKPTAGVSHTFLTLLVPADADAPPEPPATLERSGDAFVVRQRDLAVVLARDGERPNVRASRLIDIRLAGGGR
jgi:hypothetical protein